MIEVQVSADEWEVAKFSVLHTQLQNKTEPASRITAAWRCNEDVAGAGDLVITSHSSSGDYWVILTFSLDIRAVKLVLGISQQPAVWRWLTHSLLLTALVMLALQIFFRKLKYFSLDTGGEGNVLVGLVCWTGETACSSLAL